MPGIDFREVRARITMVEVLDLLGFVVTSRLGEQVRGACPLHGSSKSGKSRSCSAHVGRKTFPCFKCGAVGNHLDLRAKANRQTVYEAALDLCARLPKAGLGLEQKEQRYCES